jgi:hypothetical protein
MTAVGVVSNLLHDLTCHLTEWDCQIMAQLGMLVPARKARFVSHLAAARTRENDLSVVYAPLMLFSLGWGPMTTCSPPQARSRSNLTNGELLVVIR